MTKKLFILFIGMWLTACTSQQMHAEGAIVLGAVSGSLYLPTTYVVSVNGSGSIKVSLPWNLGSMPDWSPDGKWIISSTQYQGVRSEDSTIHLMRTNGSQRTTVIHNKWGSFDPSWSPDGTWISYIGYDDTKAGIFLIDTQCFQKNDHSCNSIPIFLTPGDGVPDWSPDGKKIVYSLNGNILVINSDGVGQPINLTPNMEYCNSPKWSPDGKKIVFSCYTPDQFNIWIANTDGTNLTNLTNGVGSNTQPDWSPDGSKIAFISQRDGLGQMIGMEDTIRSNAIFMMNADGSSVIRLSPRNDEDVLWFSWLP